VDGAGAAAGADSSADEQVRPLTLEHEEEQGCETKADNSHSLQVAAPPGFYRPRTAPPASIAPSLLLPRAYTPAALHAPSTSSSFAAPAPHARAATLSYSPQLAYLSTLRESSSEADGPPSPLETSIGVQDTDVLQRARAVSVDEAARREQLERATVQPSSGGSAARAALLDAAFVGSPGRRDAQGAQKVRAKGKERAGEDEDEPLTGDKGETTDEMAAMFASW